MLIELDKTQIVAAIALAGVLVTAWVTYWNARKGNQNAREIEKLKLEAQRQSQVLSLREPLARATYDLQSRLYNILKLNFFGRFLSDGTVREQSYAVNNTTFLIAQYCCWTDLVRNEVQLNDLDRDEVTAALVILQDRIYDLWGNDEQPPTLRIFAGEQRALGEALVKATTRGVECMGYGEFLKAFPPYANGLIDAIRADIRSLGHDIAPAAMRLTALQHALIKLLKMLDPNYKRFPEHSRSEA